MDKITHKTNTDISEISSFLSKNQDVKNKRKCDFNINDEDLCKIFKFDDDELSDFSEQDENFAPVQFNISSNNNILKETIFDRIRESKSSNISKNSDLLVKKLDNKNNSFKLPPIKLFETLKISDK